MYTSLPPQGHAPPRPRRRPQALPWRRWPSRSGRRPPQTPLILDQQAHLERASRVVHTHASCVALRFGNDPPHGRPTTTPPIGIIANSNLNRKFSWSTAYTKLRHWHSYLHFTTPSVHHMHCRCIRSRRRLVIHGCVKKHRLTPSSAPSKGVVGQHHCEGSGVGVRLGRAHPAADQRMGGRATRKWVGSLCGGNDVGAQQCVRRSGHAVR